ncbi:hypothetical protein [Argonema antarcticum]|uniref:hypothetical protein n=1 Tax=Argonema antarcticum TaxID=2942763 RepID=UPI002011F36B|nr:hypothetical protein [Argonema antarcticum]MCL1474222.1 hypothetical protein [Argonema antarcticum A004/B2]
MRNDSSLKEALLSLAKIKSITFLVVWLSAYIQLSIFSQALDSKAWQQIAYLWVLGVCIDLYVLLSAILSALSGRSISVTLGVGWMFYFLSTTFYGKLTFLRVNVDNALLLSFLKAVEFFILSCFHLLCMFISARIGGRSSQNNTEE